MEKLTIPDLITLDQYEGDFEKYNTAVYNIYMTDFMDDKPFFNSKRVKTKAHPLQDKKEYTYYHLTHDGNDESDRKPNMRRMERIRFPKPFIKNSNHSDIKVWRNKRCGDKRILLYHQEEKYLVILAERNNYVLLWTAYLVERDHSERKLLKEYKAFIKTETAQ